MIYLRSNLNQSAQQTVGQLAARPIRKHRPKLVKISALCQQGKHVQCFSLKCSCGCGHPSK